MEVVAWTNFALFEEQIGSWLGANDDENHMVLAVAAAAASSDQSVLLGIRDSASGVWIGAAARDSISPLALSCLQPDAEESVLSALTNHLHRSGLSITAVVGSRRTAHLFAQKWAALVGVRLLAVMENKLYGASSVQLRAPPPPGTFRFADTFDLKTITEWLREFLREIGFDPASADERARVRVAAGHVAIWEIERVPVAMASISGESAGSVRIATVYTPPALRGRGYGSAVVAALTGYVLHTGKRCVLFADSRNAMTNSMYQRLGYAFIADFSHMSLP